MHREEAKFCSKSPGKPLSWSKQEKHVAWFYISQRSCWLLSRVGSRGKEAGLWARWEAVR